MLGGFRHAARFGHGEHDMKIAQPNAPADAIRPIHDGTLSEKATYMLQNRASSLQPGRADFQSELHTPALQRRTAMLSRCTVGMVASLAIVLSMPGSAAAQNA